MPQLARYGVPTWAPWHFTLAYAIRGFDASPTSLRQFPTFVQRPQGWFVASFSDFASSSQRSDVDIWNFGGVRTARAPGVLVLGHPGSLDLMRDIADEASAAIPRVSAVWGRAWPRRVVVLVPSSQHELAQIIDDSGDLSQIAAVASAEVQDCPGPPNPVGYRVAINPRNWGKLSSLGRRVVLTHELTHVATRAVTGSCTPTWLVEGFADYVGYLGTGVPTTVVAQELADDVRAGRVPTHLPLDSDFDGDNKRLAQAYEGAWMAAHLIVERWSQQRSSASIARWVRRRTTRRRRCRRRCASAAHLLRPVRQCVAGLPAREPVVKVLLVTNDFPPRPGGIQSFLHGLVSRLDPADVVVYTSRWRGWQEWDAPQPFTVVREDTSVLLPTPPVRRRAVVVAA